MKKIALLIATLMLTACASYGTKVDTNQVAGFVKGKTSYNEVIDKLGKPSQTAVNSDGTKTISYVHVEYSTKAATFIPFVGIFAGGADTKNNTAELSFDSNNLLTNYKFSDASGSVSTGLVDYSK